MSLSNQERNRITTYLLEKIDEGDPSPVKKTADNFGVTPATVYKYLDRLEQEGTIRKIRRGSYEIVCREKSFHLQRSRNELISEERIYARLIRPEIAGLPNNVQHIWDYIVSEMINNIIDHSNAENVDITVFSDRMKTTVRLADDGIGIFEKIRSHFDLDSVDEAVAELFKGKLTTDRAHHSGEGIFFSSRLADSFAIVSSGRIFSHDRFDGDAYMDDIPAKGTIVYATLSNNSAKEAKDIFDKYSDPDSGFTRTCIPLNHYFESSPVSRSQAKRLCAGLEKFKTVELDFEGIDWMGQSFADQLFRVFVNEHPDTKLIPLNMNADVVKMYRHVMTA